ncbi:MAG: MerR family transcriptional regulator [Alphaproteobacteria bacterium]|nr:MerR family transcriptional regulator [Alphaproteobacteria bacterium]
MNNNEFFSSINDVSVRLGVPAHTLRYWEKQFPVAIRPTTGAGGRRYYRAETVSRLRVIKELLYSHGMTIAGVKKLLRDGNFPENATDLLRRPDGAGDGAAMSVAPAGMGAVSGEIDRAIELLENARALLN